MNVPYYDYSNDERYVDNYKYFMNSAHWSELGAKEFVKNLLKR